MCKLSVVLLVLAALCVRGIPAGAMPAAERRSEIAPSADPRGALDTPFPNTERRDHDVGELWLTITNWGFFGTEYDLNFSGCTFPAYSNTCYLFWGGLWVGAINEEGDTLVSTGCEGWAGPHYEFYPGPLDGIDDHKDVITERSTRESSPYYSPLAVSEQDFIAFYSDTATSATWPAFIGPDHEPLGIEVTQRSFAWSYSHARDFIIFDLSLKNVGEDTLRDIYVGLFLDADCGHCGEYWDKAWDDVTGFRRWRDPGDTLWPEGTTYYSWFYPDGIDVGGTAKVQSPADRIDVAWAADANGFSAPDGWPTPGVFGTRLIQTPNPNVRIAYNWWYYPPNGWAPPEVCAPTDPENPDDVLGEPDTDELKYILLTNGYIDPDQLDPVNGLCAAPADARYVLSCGPVFPPWRDPNDPTQWYCATGDSIPIYLAYVAGEAFHVDAAIPNGPTDYEGHYDFSDLAVNASWAYTVYDNPGLDTDQDGYRGDYVVSAFGDTAWLTGDRVPDFLAPGPPPAPSVTVVPGDGRVTILWDGDLSETAIDAVTGIKDFEGYRLYRSYSSATAEIAGYSRLAQYDLPLRDGSWVWHGDTIPADSLNLGMGHDDWPPPPVSEELASEYPACDYMFVDEPVLNGLPGYYSVTAFDFGFRRGGQWFAPVQVEPIESAPSASHVRAVAHPEAGTGVDDRVWVVPNPYKDSEDYNSIRWENWNRAGWSEHSRRLDFCGLPPRCTIRIFSMGGDLVDEIRHPSGHPVATESTEPWNIISRDFQAVVSGIYIFSVEYENGDNQLGRFVVIK